MPASGTDYFTERRQLFGAGRHDMSGFSATYSQADNERNNQLSYTIKLGRYPMTISLTEESNLWLTPFSDCTHVLIDSIPTITTERQTVVYNSFGVAITAMLVPALECTLVYALVDQPLFTPNLGVLTVMTRHFTQLYDSVYYNDPSDVGALFRDRIPGTQLNRVVSVEEADMLPKSKISAAHHFHYYPKEVAAAISNDRRKEALENLRLPNDATLPFAAGMLLWLGTAPLELVRMVCRSGLLKAGTTKEYIRIAKSISTEAKSLQNMVESDLRSVFELDVLVNRIDGLVDWKQEKENRTRLDVTKIKENEIFERAVQVFRDAEAIGRKPSKFTWDQFWESRWQWSAAGSIHSQYPDDEDYIIRTNPALKNKFITISNMPDVTMEYFSSRKAEIHAWASTKYEWGKQRAIYGTDLTSYNLAHFAFYNCENVLPNQFPVGSDASEGNVVSRVGGVLKDRLPFCLDFEDFNSQHSASSMKAVIDAYISVFGKDMTDEQVLAAEWTADSVSAQMIHDNVGLKETYKAKGTLLSGWRLTTFMNSVLNYIYTRMIAGTKMSSKSSLHNGDDVLIGSTNLSLTQECLKNGRKLNIRMQSAKCAYGAIAEFLRVDHRRGSKGQYLTRAVATIVHSRIESRISTDARDLAQSMENRFQDVYDRGMSIETISALRALYYKRQAKVCDMPEEDFYVIKNAHRVVGGISEEEDATASVLIEPGMLQQQGVSVPELKGVKAFARALTRQLRLNISMHTMEKRLYKATYEAVVVKNRKMKISRKNDDQWYVKVKRIYKAHKGSIAVANYGKAALIGFSLEILSRDAPNLGVTEMLNSSKRPMELLPHIV
ncbi:putative RNA dependent RNA polymerase [Plasmopara viticola lesion associated toti 3]|uniref:RNA-directed RNA polymerase n=1 Tax=Plasmopara viticola lesion associated toti 3 TaxID=2689134 RepID=A0A6B9HC80_9VIRU|nr:putative RNA dependent RNA polymerase [Plasmopara viticola lesion associated toti 3]